jgi:hypothetical protein
VADLLAVLSRGAAPVDCGRLDALLATYKALRGDARVHRAETPRAAIALSGADATSWGTGSDRWMLAAGDVAAGPAAVAMAPDELEGQFVVARLREPGGAPELFADALGMSPLFLAEDGEHVLVATSALVLAKHVGSPPDPVGAELFLRAGSQFGPRTHWAQVRRLDPATAISVVDTGAQTRVWWRPRVDEEIRRLDLRHTAERYASVALPAIDTRLRGAGRVSIDLTGGYDSRLIATLLLKAGVRFAGATNGDDDNRDVGIARTVAATGGFDWKQHPASSTAFAREHLDRAVAWGDGALEAFHLANVIASQAARRQTADVVVTGGGGEHVGAFPWLQEFHRAGRTTAVDYDRLLSMRAVIPVELSALTPAALGLGGLEYARDTLAAWAEPYRDYPNTTQLDAIYAFKSVGHFGAYRAAVAVHQRQTIPFYYRELFEVSFSAHHRWRNHHRLHRALTERLHPAIARLHTDRGGPATLIRPGTAWRFAPYYAGLARAAARKLRGRPSTDGALPVDVARSYAGSIDALATEGVLDPARMRSARLYDRGRLLELVASAKDPTFPHRAILGRIVTLELALRATDTEL